MAGLTIQPTPSASILKNSLARQLRPLFADPTALNVLHADDTSKKADFRTGPELAFWFLLNLYPHLGGYAGRITLFEPHLDTRVLSKELRAAAPPHHLHLTDVIRPGGAQVGLTLCPTLDHMELRQQFHLGLVGGGLAVVNFEVDPAKYPGPDPIQSAVNSVFAVYQGDFTLNQPPIRSPLYRGARANSVTLVLQRNFR